jgi:hypothetical protein
MRGHSFLFLFSFQAPFLAWGLVEIAFVIFIIGLPPLRDFIAGL